MRGQQQKSGSDAIGKGLENLLLTPDRLEVPVRLDGALLDDAHLTDGLDLLLCLSDHLAHRSSSSPAGAPC